jgi:hypothetical protein
MGASSLLRQLFAKGHGIVPTHSLHWAIRPLEARWIVAHHSLVLGLGNLKAPHEELGYRDSPLWTFVIFSAYFFGWRLALRRAASRK